MVFSSQSLGSARSRRRVLGVTLALLLVLAAGPAVTVVTAGNGNGNGDKKVTVDNKCTGGWFDKKTCQMMNTAIGWVLNAIAGFVDSIINGVMGALVGTPVPKHNGSPAIFQEPTNQPWSTIYDSWLSYAVPLGLVEWILMVMGVLFSQVYISDPSTELKRREMKHRIWKVLFGILGSWAIGATVLHISNGLTRTIAPDAGDITNNLVVFAGHGGSVALAAVFVWLFGGVIFLFVLLLLVAKIAVVFTMMWSLPVLLPLAAFNVGPIKLLSKPARGLIDKLFIPFVFLTLPMALVLKVGYLTVTGLNKTTTAQLGMHFSGMNSLLILGFWLVAAISPLFVFSQTGQIKGIAAGLAGASAIENLREKVQGAKDDVDWHVPPRYDKATGPHDPYEGAPSSDGGFGGPLGGSSGGADRETMLGAQQAQSNGFTGGSTAGAAGSGSAVGATTGGTALGTGAGTAGGPSGTSTSTTSGSSAGTGTTSGTSEAADRMVSPEDVTQVGHPRELPTETKYTVGHVKDGGEFQPLNNNPSLNRSKLLNGMYSHLNARTEKYSNEKLLLQSEDGGEFFDLDSMTYREQSYEEMSRQTSEDVLNS